MQLVEGIMGNCHGLVLGAVVLQMAVDARRVEGRSNDWFAFLNFCRWTFIHERSFTSGVLLLPLQTHPQRESLADILSDP